MNCYQNNITKLLLMTIFFGGLSLSPLFAQVSINNTNATPDASAMLDVSSNDKGFLTPRMTTIERENISNPATGLLVFDTDEEAFFYFDGVEWQTLRSHGATFGDTSDGNTECQKILPDIGTNQDRFGYSMDLKNNLLLIGTSSTNDTELGGAYIFEYQEDTWIQQTTLIPADAVAGDEVGTALAFYEDYAIVSASKQEDGQGAVYIFQNINGTWIEQQKLTASNAENDANFGESLAVSGDYLFIGAPLKTGVGGAVYVFQKTLTTWTEQAILTASDGVDGNLFGFPIAIADEVAVIGAVLDSENAGAAYVFQLSGGNWEEQQKLTASDAGEDHLFGYAINFIDEKILISSPLNTAGVVYTFENNGNDWIETNTLSPSNTTEQDAFGVTIVNANQKVLISALHHDSGATRSGAVYIYNYSTAEWALETKLVPSDPTASLLLGSGAVLSDDFVLVGAIGDATNGNRAGAVYYYCLKPDDGLSDDQHLNLTDNTLSIEDGNSVDLSILNTDNQTIDLFNLDNNNLQLSLENDEQDQQTVDLSSFLDNTDDQQLNLTNHNLSLEDGGATIDLNPYLDNTDNQQLSLINNDLTLEDGGFPIDLSLYLDNTDDQQLNLFNNDLMLENGGNVDLSDFKDMGTHTANSSINTNGQWLSGDGDEEEGIMITDNGNVGIRTATGNAVLSLIPPTNSNNPRIFFKDETETTIWNVGTNTTNGNFNFFDNVNSASTFVLEQGAASNTLYIDENSRVGIGTNDPINGKLEVTGIEETDFSLSDIGFLNTNGANTGTYSGQFSVYADGRIGAFAFIAHSDERIKNIKGISDGQEDLEILKGIKITDYTMKDSIQNGRTAYKKVIAQQVAEVYPQAVFKHTTEIIPNIYQTATIDEKGWINLATDLKVGDKVQIIFEEGAATLKVLEATPNAFRVLPSTVHRQPSTPEKKSGQAIFIYGKQVNDFHTVDYEAISMLNVSATQQLAKENEHLKARVEQLEKNNVLLRTQLEKVEQLEMLLQQLQAQLK